MIGIIKTLKYYNQQIKLYKSYKAHNNYIKLFKIL